LGTINGLGITANSGTITAGTWNGSTIATTYGGTGINGSAAANGTLLIGNGSGYSLNTLTAGSGITIDNSLAGHITISQIGSGGSQFTENNSLGILYPNISTLDFLLGGTATSSARFAFLNNAGGTPVASISAGSGNNALFLTGNGTVGTTNRQTLALGGVSTGNITLQAQRLVSPVQ